MITTLLDICEERFGPVVDLDADHYWSIWPSAAFDLGQEPAVLAGQLSDDVALIAADAGVRREPEMAWHELGHVLGVLTRLAAMLAPEAPR